jgi:hypothetical protein
MARWGATAAGSRYGRVADAVMAWLLLLSYFRSK